MFNLVIPVHPGVKYYLDNNPDSKAHNIYFSTYIPEENRVVNYRILYETYDTMRYPNIYINNFGKDIILYVRFTGLDVYMIDPKKKYGKYQKAYIGKQAYIQYTPYYDISYKVDKYPYYRKNDTTKYAIKHTSRVNAKYYTLFEFLEDYRSEIASLTMSKSVIEFENNLNKVLSNYTKNYKYLIRYYDQALVFNKKNKYIS